ncbi:hypothetical protein JAAARDRAFT_144062 [Jaapia argillacea MUCL 33604]|uniref:CxC2-like cysteine cluster KDZ transposase-associated domain-containing protein n=1 Tax=Jaapia argillacea MUCL 33604 TaxID=933084 RepID=A0A067PEW3_9AGAM|nr:hypothetical protein JAAARDRAFT_144062 [Jaapia argillacea MUCL 33604]
MKDLIDAIPELEGFLLECDAYQPLQPKCQCGQPPTVQCIDCLDSVYRCSACTVKSHQSSPLHWVEEWNGSFFEHRGLDNLACYFPATLKQPSTVFTFSLLNHFHPSTLQSKVAAYDYFIVLKHLSNNAFPASQYRKLLRVVRIWRYLMARKRSGHIHGVDDVLPHRKKGLLVPRCYACPEPHFNMPLNWENTPLNKR